MFCLFIGRVSILGTIKVLVVAAGMIGTAIADVRRHVQFFTNVRSKIRAVLCAVTGSAAFAGTVA